MEEQARGAVRENTGTRFTRVTIIGLHRRLDLSVPAQAPLIEVLPTVLRMLSVPVTGAPAAWRLAAPELGTIEESRSLDDVGVFDGAQLHLVEAASAPPPPFVDDVESAVAESVTDCAPSWSGSSRRGVTGVLLSVVLLAGVACGWTAPPPINWVAPLGALLGAAAAGRLISERGGWACALVIPAAAVTLFCALVGAESLHTGLASPAEFTRVARWEGFPLTVVLVAGVALVAVGVIRRARAVAVGGVVTPLLAAGAVTGTASGLPPERVAGLALLFAVVVTGIAGQVAVGSARVVDLLVADERGQPVAGTAVGAAVRRGLGTVTGLVWGASAAAVAAAGWLIIGSAALDSIAVGVVGVAIFGLRSRMFSRAAHVAPMLGVVVAGAVALALRASSEAAAGSVWLAPSLLAVCGLGLCCGLVELPAVGAARVQRALDRLELATTLALVPGLVLLFGVIPAVLRQWH